MATDPRTRRRRWLTIVLVSSVVAVACSDDDAAGPTTAVTPVTTVSPTSAAPVTTAGATHAFQELLDALLRTTDLPAGWRTAIAPEVLSGANLAPSLVAVPLVCDIDWSVSNGFDWHVWTTMQNTDPQGDSLVVAEMLTTGDPDTLAADLAVLAANYRTCQARSDPGMWVVEVRGTPPEFGLVSVTVGSGGWRVQTNEYRLVGDTLAAVAVTEERTKGATSCVEPVRPDAGTCRFDLATIDRIVDTAVTRLGG